MDRLPEKVDIIIFGLVLLVSWKGQFGFAFLG